ncbi:DUF2703 domain-containing protein [Hydrogenophaga sp. PBL-H3]|uniref:DUF2703 domain-containing protein n=1 Tax=Hydrogenophaga sp. PBL-H3 TaxID=434010 RepID=UPI001F2B875B|nr:DUF2703 domain-containing protein [Hydrogenophaga sp. PBL-H3]
MLAALEGDQGFKERVVKQMPIVWKRLVKGGATCARCESTGLELEAAVTKLADALRPLGIEPVLETREIDEAAFKDNTSESNRVWIGGRSIEEWLGAAVGMSRCCSVCGESDCRTLELDGRIYETIPENQFVRAGLMAASEVMGSPSSQVGATASCCSASSGADATSANC